MYCKECGKQIDDDSKYCRYCGKCQYYTNNEEIKSNQTLNSEVPKLQNYRSNNDFTLCNLPRTTVNQVKMTVIKKYDDSYEKEHIATIVGIVVMIIFLISCLFSIGDGSSGLFITIAMILNTLWRIVATIWIVGISKRQNRESLGWGIFGFFSPNLALIIIGLQKKLYVEEKSSERASTAQSQNIPQIDFDLIDDEEIRRIMSIYDIKFENDKYLYSNYKYEKLKDAVNYAKLMMKR